MSTNDFAEGKIAYCEDNPEHHGVYEVEGSYYCSECDAALKYAEKNFVRFRKSGKMWLGFAHPTRGNTEILGE